MSDVHISERCYTERVWLLPCEMRVAFVAKEKSYLLWSFFLAVPVEKSIFRKKSSRESQMKGDK
jgi:hypothetical protein